LAQARAFLKKDEKGILILAAIVRQRNEGTEQNEPDESSTAIGFRAAYVFEISQTVGQDLPASGGVNGDPRKYREQLVKFVADKGIALEYSEDIAPARGTSVGGKITLLGQFLDNCQRKGWLSTEERQLLIEFKLEGISGPELARRNGHSVVAIRHRIQRLLDRLRRIAQSSGNGMPQQLNLFLP
jgi:hypothetical protein